MGLEQVGLTRRLVGMFVGRLPDICLMTECGVVVLFLPCLCALHDASRQPSGVVGGFLEWRFRWSLHWLLAPLPPLPLQLHHHNRTTTQSAQQTHHEPQTTPLTHLPSLPRPSTRVRLSFVPKRHRIRSPAQPSFTRNKTLHAVARET